MKTKELIRQLQEADPSGELECNTGGADIRFVERLEGYYDGPYEVLLWDETRPYAPIIGAKITTRGEKVKLHTSSIRDVILDDVDIPVEVDVHYSDGGKIKQEIETKIEKWRQEVRDIDDKIERDVSRREKDDD